MAQPERMIVFNCPMDSASMADTVTYIDASIRDGKFLQHGAINVGKLVNMQDDPELHKAVSACDLISIDGMGLVWSGRLLGLQIPERVTGIDLFHELIALSARHDYPVYLLGAEQNVVERTVEVLQAEYPDLRIAGYHHGYFSTNEEQVVEGIRASGAKLLFVAMSSPQKETFINRWKDQFDVIFVMGVGGTFDVVSGKVHRAPAWMQKAGLEWLYRAYQEPRRMFKRYLVSNLRFGWMLVKQFLRNRR